MESAKENQWQNVSWELNKFRQQYVWEEIILTENLREKYIFEGHI